MENNGKDKKGNMTSQNGTEYINLVARGFQILVAVTYFQTPSEDVRRGVSVKCLCATFQIYGLDPTTSQ